MTSFEILVFAHCAGDWLFQTEYEALNKMKGRFPNVALLKHCAVYMLCFIPVFAMLKISMLWLFLIFGSHLILDRRTPVIWWIRTIKYTNQETIDKLPWLVIVIDQILHIAVLAIIAVIA